jgi:hypothetical protein
VKHFNLTSIRRHHLEVFSSCFKCYCYVPLGLNSFIQSSTILNSDVQNYDYLLGRMGVKCRLYGGTTIFERKTGWYATDFHSCLLRTQNGKHFLLPVPPPPPHLR